MPIGRVSKATRRDRVLAVVALLTIVAAWIVGAQRSAADLEPFLARVFPRAEHFERGSGSYAAQATDGAPIGYFATGIGDGFNGPLVVGVGLDPQGAIVAVAVIEHRETPSYAARVFDSGLLTALRGEPLDADLRIGASLDGVSGATRTSTALLEGARAARRAVAAERLGTSLPPDDLPPFRFGVREVALLLLFGLGLLSLARRFPYTRAARWASLLIGMVVLGFVFDAPLTVGFVSKLLLGYWPGWRTDLYWILLGGGVLLLLLVQNRNPYCTTFCPFGATQECLGAIGGARLRTPPRLHSWLRWLQRVLAWLAIVLALLFRNPGATSYEVFSALFDFVGATWQFVLLGLVVVISLFVKRPWCRYLCPVAPVVDFVKLLRSWCRDVWRGDLMGAPEVGESGPGGRD